MNPFNLEVSWESLWRVLIMAGFVAVLLLAKETVIVLLLAIFISAALDNWVVRLERLFPRLLATLVVYLVFLLILAFILYAIIPVAILELKGLLKNLGNLSSDFLGGDTQLYLEGLIDPNLERLTNLLLSGNPSSFFGVISRVLGGATLLLATLITSFYLTASRDGVGNFLRAVFPENLESKALDIYYRSKRKIGRWFQAQLLLALVVGLVTFLGLVFTPIKYALLLSLIAAIFEIVPVVGPIFAGAVAVVVALTESVDLAIYVLILYLVIQQLENHVLVPVIMQKALDLHPVVILIALLAGLEIAGPVGMILAVPTTVVLGEVIHDWMAEKRARQREQLEI